MKRLFKAHITPGQKLATFGLLVSLIVLVYPESAVLAHGTDVPAENFTVVTTEKARVLRYDEVVKSDLYNQELTKFLEKYNSPFVSDVETLRKLPEMKRVLAISFVESTMGQHCYYYNCSGITLRSGQLKKYNSYAEWMQDLNSLLQRRYNGWEYQDMMGVYVVPGSANWLNGTTHIHAQLDELEQQVNQTQYVSVAVNKVEPVELK